jgi:hypothetical protein
MERDFKGLPCVATGTMGKVLARGIEENEMNKRGRKHPLIVEVQILYEPGRLAQDCLHQAYLFLVPVTRRRISPTVTQKNSSTQVEERQTS